MYRAYGILARHRNALHARGVLIHIHHLIGCHVNDRNNRNIRRHIAIVPVQTLTRDKQAIAVQGELGHLGQAIRIGKSRQIDRAQGIARHRIDDEQLRASVPRDVRLVLADKRQVVRVAAVAS